MSGLLRLNEMFGPSMVSGYVCAGCGEWNETAVDESAGSRQRYVEDCRYTASRMCCASAGTLGLKVVIDTKLE